MSNLNPGGSRSSSPRVFTAAGIRDACKSNAKHETTSETSLADQPHTHSREIARRLRQEARRCAK